MNLRNALMIWLSFFSPYAFADHGDCAHTFPSNQWVDLQESDWRGMREQVIPEGWAIAGDSLIALPGPDATDLVTKCQFHDFAFDFEWAVSPGGNGGVKYCVLESVGAVGLEYQVLDDQNHPDGQFPNRRAGSLYDVYETQTPTILAPVGDFNRGTIVYFQGVGEHYLNGQLVVFFNQNSGDYRYRLSQSKLKKYPHLQTPGNGHILLQHHGEEVIYRRLRLMNLNPEQPLL